MSRFHTSRIKCYYITLHGLSIMLNTAVNMTGITRLTQNTIVSYRHLLLIILTCLCMTDNTSHNASFLVSLTHSRLAHTVSGMLVINTHLFQRDHQLDKFASAEQYHSYPVCFILITHHFAGKKKSYFPK